MPRTLNVQAVLPRSKSVTLKLTPDEAQLVAEVLGFIVPGTIPELDAVADRLNAAGYECRALLKGYVDGICIGLPGGE